MTDLSMTPQRVLDLIAVYGAEPGGWPDEERDAAHHLLKTQPEKFSDALAQARALDAMLVEFDSDIPEPDTDLTARILAAAPSPAPAGPVTKERWLPFGLRWPAGIAFASLFAGLISGYAYASVATTDYDSSDEIYASVFGYDIEVWSELEQTG